MTEAKDPKDFVGVIRSLRGLMTPTKSLGSLASVIFGPVRVSFS